MWAKFGTPLLLFCLALPAVILPSSALASNQVVRSSDELELKYLHTDTNPLYGDPGTMRKLLFVFKSRGKGGRFQVTVSTSHEGFEGTAIPSFSIPDQGMKTIEWNNLIVPATVPVGDKVELTLTVKRMDNTVASQMSEVHRSVYFTVGSLSADDSQPEVWLENSGSCPVSRNNTALCGNYHWHLEIHIQDKESGLRDFSGQVIGKESITKKPVSYSFPNYIIGTTDTVDVIADISCCHSGARLTAVNMQGIQTDLLCEEGRNGSQRLTGRGLAMTSVVTSFILLVTSSSVLANVS